MVAMLFAFPEPLSFVFASVRTRCASTMSAPALRYSRYPSTLTVPDFDAAAGGGASQAEANRPRAASTAALAGAVTRGVDAAETGRVVTIMRVTLECVMIPAPA